MKPRRFLPALLLPALFWACRPEPVNPAAYPDYFSTKEFIAQQVTLLNQQKAGLHKLARLDGTQEEARVANPRWERELALFNQADLAKPALKDAYKVDSTQSAEGLQVLYTPKDTSLAVKELRVIFDPQGQVAQLHVFNRTSNLLLDNSHRLSLYTEKKGGKRLVSRYQIESSQMPLFTSDVYSLVKGDVIQ